MDTQDDREDLIQEITYQPWKSYPAFNEMSQFSTWMYRVAINTAILYLKKEKKRLDKHSILPEMDIGEETEPNPKESQLEHFYQAVQQLSPIEKALIFYYMEGLTYREIGINMGITEGNARVKLNRIKEKITQIVKLQGYEF
jgi:RNA polymerase sigma factor (sigma-70 family)